jgi:hypothetical protein
LWLVRLLTRLVEAHRPVKPEEKDAELNAHLIADVLRGPAFSEVEFIRLLAESAGAFQGRSEFCLQLAAATRALAEEFGA